MKHRPLSLMMLVLPLATACSQSRAIADGAESREPDRKGEVAMPAANTARVRSSVDTLAFKPLTTLPQPAKSSRPRLMCETFVVEPESTAGKRVAKAGWSVTGEGRIGRYQAVSFASSFEPGTSGTCGIGDGNVGIFEGDRLVALAYTPKASDRPIGWIVPFESDSLRIWDGDIGSQPLADVRLEDGRLSIVPLADEERFCGGRSVVPNIYGMPIGKARRALWAKDWEQVPNGDAADRSDPREAALAGRGVTEVASCSGTGFAYCSYDYNRTESALTVTTIGDDEDPVVAGYNVRCKD